MIASGAGKQGYPNLAAYCASKFGVIGFAQALAAEVRDDNVKVSTICPGGTDTTFAAGFPPSRLAGQVIRVLLPEDVAEAVLVLLHQSERAWTQEMNLWPWKPRDGWRWERSG